MPLVTCPMCGKSIKCRDEHLGKQVRCPACAEPFTAGSLLIPGQDGRDAQSLQSRYGSAAPVTEPVAIDTSRAVPESRRVVVAERDDSPSLAGRIWHWTAAVVIAALSVTSVVLGVWLARAPSAAEHAEEVRRLTDRIARLEADARKRPRRHLGVDAKTLRTFFADRAHGEFVFEPGDGHWHGISRSAVSGITLEGEPFVTRATFIFVTSVADADLLARQTAAYLLFMRQFFPEWTGSMKWLDEAKREVRGDLAFSLTQQGLQIRAAKGKANAMLIHVTPDFSQP